MSEFELKPCPCCGGKADYHQADEDGCEGGWFVECEQCKLTTPLVFPEKVDHRERLHDIWNTRTEKRPNPPEGCRLEAVDTGDGWCLQVGYPYDHELEGEAVALLAWPDSWPETMTAEQLEKAGFEIV